MSEIKIIPVFPLPIVVFPHEELRLHIFEPRYKELIRDCDEKGIVFGITPVIENKMMDIGTIVKLDEIVKEYEDGRMDIKLSSEGLFRVHKYHAEWPGKMYSAVDMLMLDSDTNGEIELVKKVMDLFNSLCELNHVKPFHPISWDEFISFKLGHYVGFSVEEEYRFCILPTENERLHKLVQQIEYMIEQSKQRQEWLKRMNMNGEFRNFDSKDWK